jgi:diguanylate cyclase (GGDEF)-like protein
VLFIDLDRFKLVNDSLGHITGDKLLVEIARRLAASVRPGDTIARLGGDEFTVLLDEIRDLGEATRIAERIGRELSEPHTVDGSEVFASASIGIALSNREYESAENVLRDADIAMYRAKALGKARYAVFDPTMHARAVEMLSLETALRRALDRDEFRIHYQPIVHLEDGRLAGFEALVRWAHPERGLVPPAEFIPLAEETGLIAALGRHVLQESCRQLLAWQREFPDQALTVSVNVSPRQLSQPDLLQEVEAILAETGLDPRSLVLEVTESAIIENPDAANAVFAQLSALGIRLALDDFGTGYSSLSYLHRFPFDKLKIDRSFITSVADDARRTEIVRSITALGANLGMELVAEGVETAEQRNALVDLKCQYAQGYFFSRPVDAFSARALLREAAFPERLVFEAPFSRKAL